jgi:hypothetical protein
MSEMLEFVRRPFAVADLDKGLNRKTFHLGGVLEHWASGASKRRLGMYGHCQPGPCFVVISALVAIGALVAIEFSCN